MKKQIRNFVVLLAVLTVAGVGIGGELVLTNQVKTTVSESGTVIVGDSLRCCETGYPALEVGQPAFWIDASERVGWTYGTTDPGKVTKIPNRSCAKYPDRYLYNSETYAPTLDTAPGSPFTLDGAACLDFGAVKNYGCALQFDAVADAEGCAASNVLRRIGTIIAIYDSSAGGGYLMGGGYISDGLYPKTVTGYAWCRDNPDDPFKVMIHPTNPFYTCSGMAVRHDGILSRGKDTGFRGGWETFSAMMGDASAEASGIGMGDCRNGNYRGGFKIAEMLIYDRKLTEAECALVEDYLNRKWFNRKVVGVNGNSYLSCVYVYGGSYGTDAYTGGIPVTFNTAEGQKLTVGRVIAGHRGGCSFTKTGAGAIEFEDAENFTAPLYLAGGTLAFNRRPIPSALVGDPEFVFDMSDPANYVTETDGDGVKRVVTWKNTGSWADRYAALRQDTNADSHAPLLVEDTLAGGKPVMDFGPYGTTGARLSLYADAEADITTVSRTSTAIKGYIAVLSPFYNGSMQPISGYWGDTGNNLRRGAGASAVLAQLSTVDQKFAFGARTYYDYGFSRSVVPEAWINGLRRTAYGFAQTGFQVMSVQTQPDNFGGIMQYGSSGAGNGGGMAAEMAMFKHTLSEQEMRDNHAYLMRKWLNRRAPGYRRFDTAGTPDLQDVRVTAPSVIEVAAGDTIRIGRLTLSAPLEKRGAGTLEVVEFVRNSQRLTVVGGQMRYADASDPGAEALAALAAHPSFHLDATDTSSMVFDTANGTNYIHRWYDRNFRNYAIGSRGNYTQEPWLNDDPSARLNGHPVVDFGVFTFDKDPSVQSATMVFGSPVPSIRSVFMVRGSQGGGGWMLANTHVEDLDFGTCWNFYPGGNITTTHIPTTYFQTGAMAKGLADNLYTNGVKCAGTTTYPSGGYDLVEIHCPYGELASAFCIESANGKQRGGQRIGEMLLYERKLTEREKIATRNYLMKKWFGKTDDELTPLPAKPASRTDEIPPSEITVDGGLEVTPETIWSNVTVKGEGTLVKSGDGTLEVKSLLSFTGVVAVAGGKLAVTGVPVPVPGTLKTDGLLAHFDANVGVTVNSSGYVTKWESTVGNMSARSSSGVQLVNYGLNGMPIIKMNSSFMRFYDDGQEASMTLEGIKSVVWAIGSQEGGGFVLGGGGTGFAWHRDDNVSKPMGGDSGSAAGDHILCSSAADQIEYGFWWMNSESILPKQTGLSGEWDLLSFVFNDDWPSTGTRKMSADATGLAFDDRSGGIRKGYQRLAEVAIYDHCLSDEERIAAESYLAAKWAIRGAVPYGTNDVRVLLSSDATLDCGGVNQYFAAVGGSGTVENGGVKTAKLVYDFDNPGTLTVDGTFAFGEGFSVAVTGTLPTDLPAKGVKILSATSFANRENFNRKAVTGVEAGKYVLRLRSDGLYLGPVTGMLLLVQ